jgi:aspartyl-tRNA(Asn)/glutamyl-tRNA(Gln) amidotransferase subunit C
VIERSDVDYVARLARLRLSDEEAERMTRELANVLGYIEHIEELDLEGVEPTSHVVPLENVLRADEPHNCLSHDAALANAPDVTDDGFAVPAPGG